MGIRIGVHAPVVRPVAGHEARDKAVCVEPAISVNRMGQWSRPIGVQIDASDGANVFGACNPATQDGCAVGFLMRKYSFQAFARGHLDILRYRVLWTFKQLKSDAF